MSASGYDPYVEYFDQLFPVHPEQTKFILSLISGSQAAILDVGCSTGALAINLAQSGHVVMGIDLNKKMIDLAKTRQARTDNACRFVVADMLEIQTLVPPHSLDLLLCMGNTLPHLLSWREIRTFLLQVRNALTPSGKVLLQVLNYEKLAASKAQELAVLHFSAGTFTRRYTWLDNGRIQFNTQMVLNSGERYPEQSWELLPITQQQLVSLMQEIGFVGMVCYGDYKSSKVTDETNSILIVAGG